jgi:hypothetical protein
MEKILNLFAPEILSLSTPVIVRLLLIEIESSASVIVSPASAGMNVIASPFWATATASRSEQSALHTMSFVSASFVTVQVAADAC